MFFVFLLFILLTSYYCAKSWCAFIILWWSSQNLSVQTEDRRQIHWKYLPRAITELWKQKSSSCPSDKSSSVGPSVKQPALSLCWVPAAFWVLHQLLFWISGNKSRSLNVSSILGEAVCFDCDASGSINNVAKTKTPDPSLSELWPQNLENLRKLQYFSDLGLPLRLMGLTVQIKVDTQSSHLD